MEASMSTPLQPRGQCCRHHGSLGIALPSRPLHYGLSGRWPFARSNVRDAALLGNVKLVRSMAERFEGTSYADYYDYDSSSVRGREEALQRYEDLKENLRRRSQRFGVGLAAYLFLTVSGEAALAALVGTVASLLYLEWLIRDADRINEDTEVPLMAAQLVEQQPLRALAIGFAAYRHAFNPRLIIVILLGAGIGAYNTFGPRHLEAIEEVALFFGFSSYKAALLLVMWDDLKPKFDPELAKRPQRPELAILPDVERLELRQPGQEAASGPTQAREQQE